MRTHRPAARTPKSAAYLRQYFEGERIRLKLEHPNDWYKVRREQLKFKELLRDYSFSLYKALKTAYPEVQWYPWKFAQASKHVWKEVSHRSYFNWLSNELGIKTQEDWYSVGRSAANTTLLATFYNNSLIQALSKVYPEYIWHPWRFPHPPRDFWHSLDNQKTFLNWVAETLGVENPEDWFRVQFDTIVSLGGSGLLFQYDGSLLNALEKVFPEHKWKQLQHHRLFFEWLAPQLNIEEPTQWYNVTNEVVKAKGGGTLLSFYGCLATAIIAVYPEIDWKPWLFAQVPRLFWTYKNNQRDYFDWLQQELKLENMDEWYRVLPFNVIQKRGEGLLFHYGGSLAKALQSVYSEYDWHPWLFTAPPDNLWADLKTQRKYFDWLGHKLEIRNRADWYRVSTDTIRKNHGGDLLRKYGNSQIHLFRTVFPEYEWDPQLFPMELEEDTVNLRKHMDWIASQLGIIKIEDWYSVKGANVRESGGHGLLPRFNNSLRKVLEAAYPEVHWIPWRFEKVPRDFWDDIQNQRMCFEWLAEVMGVAEPQQWAFVSREDVKEAGGGGLLSFHNGSMIRALRMAYPELDWAAIYGLSEGQRHATNLLKRLFERELLINYKHPRMLHLGSSRTMELDIYIPSLELAFEYNGSQHYSKYYSIQGARDEEKRRACEQLGITLIDIPYWWDNSLATLITTINTLRPDVHIPNAAKLLLDAHYHPRTKRRKAKNFRFLPEWTRGHPF